METLNEKILNIIYDVHCDTDNWGHCGGINIESRKEAAKEIEKLILQEKIDLLEEMRTQKNFDAIVLNIPIRVYNFRMELLKLNN